MTFASATLILVLVAIAWRPQARVSFKFEFRNPFDYHACISAPTYRRRLHVPLRRVVIGLTVVAVTVGATAVRRPSADILLVRQFS